MRWTVHGERSLYESDWVSLRLVDIELPNGERFEHHVVRMPAHASGVVMHEPERGVLLLWRHRFISDTWGWEIPTGRIDAGETPEEAGIREAIEETGHRPGPLDPLGYFYPSNGLNDQRFYVFTATGAERVGEPDGIETDRVEWHPIGRVRELIRRGEILDGYSLTALLLALAEGRLDGS